jgi:hypothetical protein
MSSIQNAGRKTTAAEVFADWLRTSTASEWPNGIRVDKRVDKTEAKSLVEQARGLSEPEQIKLRETLAAHLQADGFATKGGKEELERFITQAPPVSSTKASTVTNAQQTRVQNETDQRTRVSLANLKAVLSHPLLKGDAFMRSQLANLLLARMQAGGLNLDAEGRNFLKKFIAANNAEATGFPGMTLSQLAGPSAEDNAKMGATLGEAQRALSRALGNNMMTGARDAMTSVVNRVEGNGGLDALSRSLDMGAKPMSYAAYVAAHGGSFEDILFAFLMQLADKVDRKLEKHIRDMEKRERMEQMKQKTQQGLEGAVGPAGGSPLGGPGGAGPSAGGGVASLTGKLESTVQSAHAFTAADSEGGATITKREADRLVKRLSDMPENVQQLLAGSIGSAIKNSHLPLQKEAFDALTTWGKDVLGDKFDVGTFEAMQERAKAAKGSAKTDLGKAFEKSDKLEDKLAAYLVDILGEPQPQTAEEARKSPVKEFRKFKGDLDAFLGSPSEGPAKGNGATAAADAAAGAAPNDVGALSKGAAQGDVGALPDLTGQVPQNAPEEYQKSEALAQNELQRLMNERQRIFDMLSNIMKAMFDMIMTSVRNMR